MKLKIVSLVLLFLLANFVQAQVKFFRVKKLNADSLVALIHEKEATELVEVLNLLSNVICRKDIDSSITLANQAIDLSEKLEYQKGLADGYFNIGNGYFLSDSLQPTITNYLKAQRIYEDIEPTEEYANLLMQLGVVNYFTGKIEVSKPYNRQANRIYESLNDREGMFNASFGMGIYHHVHRPLYLDSVIYYCLKAKSFLDTVNDQNEIAYLYAEIGGAHQAKSNETGDTSYLSRGISWNSKGLAMPDINDDAKSHLYNNEMGLYDAFNTVEGLDSCKAIIRKIGGLCDTCRYLTDSDISVSMWLGWISYREGDYNSAIISFKHCIGLIDIKLSDFSVNDYVSPINGYNSRTFLKGNKTFIYSYLSEIYQEFGDFEKALEYYILRRQSGDEAYLERNQNLIAWMGSSSENEKTKSRIALLARDNELHKMKVKQSRTWLIGLGGFVLIFVFVTILFFRQRKIRTEHKTIVREQKLMHDLEITNIESKKLKELDQLKSRFFANISHEFRTPLTLILSPVKKLLDSITDKNHRHDLLVIHQYARKLGRLINQLLSLSKLEAGKLKLIAKQENIIKLVSRYTQSFESLAKQRQVALIFSTESEKMIASVDRNKLEIIINNLLSNAFKFTPDKGRIEVVIKDGPDDKNGVSQVQIIVSDSGIGIQEDELEKIFDRFYIADDSNNRQQEGTGIGLALAKELIELHNGEIRVESKMNEGATFTINLPIDNSGKQVVDTTEAEQIDILESRETFAEELAGITNEYQRPENNLEVSEPEGKISNPLLLIVEDNPDLRAHIRYYLSDYYRVIEARDGEEGFAEAIENIPDLILSDVMMPKVDGHFLCKKLKTDERTSHIPIILLTARASKESRIEGLETGADDFITKPFDIDELLVRVRNLIEQRRRLSKVLEKKIQKSQNAIFIDFEDSGITSMDEQFLQKTFSVLKERYTDPEFSVEIFCKDIGLSRIQLHRKIKALIRQTTGEFIRSYRLHRAAVLLKKHSATIAEIAYDVGFSSPSYFSECFRKEFGKSPSEFTEDK